MRRLAQNLQSCFKRPTAFLLTRGAVAGGASVPPSVELDDNQPWHDDFDEGDAGGGVIGLNAGEKRPGAVPTTVELSDEVLSSPRTPKKYVQRKGDWVCPACAMSNFASRRECYKCRVARPTNLSVDEFGTTVAKKPAGSNQRDWECPNCLGNNFAFRAICFHCGVPRSKPDQSREAVVNPP